MTQVLIRSYASESQLMLHLGAFPKTPMLFATSSLRRGFLDPERNWSRVTGPAIIFKELLKFIAPAWRSRKRKLQWHAHLGPILRNALQGTTGDERSAWKALVNGRRSVLAAIELLVLSGLCPADIGNGNLSRAEGVFLDAWKAFEANFSGDAEFTPDALRRAIYGQENELLIPEAVSALTGAQGPHPRIILAGFYFISPVQYRVFEALRTQGWTLIFLNYYDPDRKGVFKVWEKTFGPNTPFCILHETWETAGDAESPNPIADALHCALTGHPRPPVKTPPPLVEYATPVDMVEDYLRDCLGKATEQSPPSDRLWFTRDRNTLRNLVSSLDPDGNKDLPGLAQTPAGQFLVTIHDCWREDRTVQTGASGFVLSRERFRALLMSGFLNSTDGQRSIVGRDLAPALERLFDYLRGVDEVRGQDGQVMLPVAGDSIDRWLKRLDLAGAAIRESEAFDTQAKAAIAAQGGRERFHRYLRNPYRYLSFVRVGAQEVEDIKSLVTLIRDRFANPLLQGSFEGATRIRDMIAFLLDQQRETATEYEKETFEQLLGSLDGSADDSALLQFAPDEFASAIGLLLGEPISADDMESPEGRISALEDLDRLHGFAPLAIHVADLSAKWIPSSESPVPWPLTKSMLEAATGDANALAKRLVTQLEARAEADLFLFYGALAISPDVVLSWSHQLDGEESVASPFLRLLDLTPTPPASGAAAAAAAPTAPVRTVREPFAVEDFPIDAAFIYSICPRRYVYDFVVHEGPFYESGFQQGFAISSFLNLRARNPVPRYKATPTRRYRDSEKEGSVKRESQLAVREPEVVEEFRTAFAPLDEHSVWASAALLRGLRAAKTVSTAVVMYPAWDADYARVRFVYERGFLRMLLLPSAHDEAWTEWRRQVSYEPLYSTPSDRDGAMETPPESTASDQRMGEFLNTYWEPPRRHVNGRTSTFPSRGTAGMTFEERKKAAREEANRHQASRVAERREAFRDGLATPDKVNEVVPEAHPGGWCQKCPHAGYCAAVQRKGEETEDA